MPEFLGSSRRAGAHDSCGGDVLKGQDAGSCGRSPEDDPTASSSPLPSKRSHSVRRTGRMTHGRVTPPRGERGARLLGMNKRKLLIVLATAGVALAALGPATKNASAEQRTLLVT